MIALVDKRKVLLVDDDRSVVKMLKVRLEAEGYDIEQALDGETALDLMEKEPPDIMLLDIAMPTITGVDILERMSESPSASSIPVIIITAYQSRIKLVEHHDAVKKCFVKPFDAGELSSSIKEILAGGR